MLAAVLQADQSGQSACWPLCNRCTGLTGVQAVCYNKQRTCRAASLAACVCRANCSVPWSVSYGFSKQGCVQANSYAALQCSEVSHLREIAWSGHYMPWAVTLRFIERWEFLQDGQHWPHCGRGTSEHKSRMRKISSQAESSCRDSCRRHQFKKERWGRGQATHSKALGEEQIDAEMPRQVQGGCLLRFKQKQAALDVQQDPRVSKETAKQER